MGFLPRFARLTGDQGGGSFAITSTSGTLSHGSSITINGAQFGTKSPAGPIIYDDASGTNPITTGWNTVAPDAAGSPFDLHYTTPATLGRGVSLPHTNITKYIVGCHRFEASNQGWNCGLWKMRTVAKPAYTYWSMTHRVDPSWSFSSGDPADQNFKYGGLTLDAYYDPAGYWYTNYAGSSWTNNTIEPTHQLYDSAGLGGSMGIYYGNDNTAGNLASNWLQFEHLYKITIETDGFVTIIEDGKQMLHYDGQTDIEPDGTRHDMIGGYARNRGPDQFRYMTDVYLDYTFSRVVLGNASTIGACTRREPQVCTAWSSTQITCTMKHGRIPTGSAWLYVFDSSNASTPGFAVTLV